MKQPLPQNEALLIEDDDQNHAPIEIPDKQIREIEPDLSKLEQMEELNSHLSQIQDMKNDTQQEVL